jgi:PDZ domain-containing protein
MNRRLWTLVVSALTLVALVAIALVLPVPYIRLAPGPTYNVIGQVGDREVIEITGTTVYPTSGALDMTTVRESGGPRGGLTFVQAIGAWFSESDAVVPQELVYREEVTAEQIKERQAELFEMSESNAVAAALGFLGLPVRTTTYVSRVFVETPAYGVLRAGDVVLTLDDQVISSPAQFAETIRGTPVGTEFRIRVLRDGVEQDVNLRSAANPEDPELGYLGINLAPFYQGDFDIRLNLEDIGGPSAGMMFALGIVNKLTPDDLTGGNVIAGTGTVQPDGSIGPVGGVRQKMAAARTAGAELFLMAPRQCPETEGRVPDGLTVVPVETLADAVATITAWGAGQSVARCPVPGDDER